MKSNCLSPTVTVEEASFASDCALISTFLIYKWVCIWFLFWTGCTTSLIMTWIKPWTHVHFIFFWESRCCLFLRSFFNDIYLLPQLNWSTHQFPKIIYYCQFSVLCTKYSFSEISYPSHHQHAAKSYCFFCFRHLINYVLSWKDFSSHLALKCMPSVSWHLTAVTVWTT